MHQCLPCLELRKREQILDQKSKAGCVFFDFLQKTRRDGWIIFRAIKQSLDIPFDQRERGAEFVADVRDEFTPYVFQFFEPGEIVEYHHDPAALVFQPANPSRIDLEKAPLLKPGNREFELANLSLLRHAFRQPNQLM